MSDKLKVLAGLLIFVGLVASPFLLNTGNAKPAPEIVISDTAKAKANGKCVADADWMRANHMQKLDEWRDTVVREGKRIEVAENGMEFNMSLSSGPNSCLGCHDNKAEFCDRCHDYVAVDAYCWECHVDPTKENK